MDLKESQATKFHLLLAYDGHAMRRWSTDVAMYSY